MRNIFLWENVFFFRKLWIDSNNYFIIKLYYRIEVKKKKHWKKIVIYVIKIFRQPRYRDMSLKYFFNFQYMLRNQRKLKI